MTNFFLSNNTNIDILFKRASRALGYVRSSKRPNERVLSVLTAEGHIARLRTYNATGRLYGKFAELTDCERRLAKLKKLPSVARELCL